MALLAAQAVTVQALAPRVESQIHVLEHAKHLTAAQAAQVPTVASAVRLERTSLVELIVR